MNLQITNPIYSTKMTTPIVSQGARASSKDMPHEVFLFHLLSEQFYGGHVKILTNILCFMCKKF